MGERHTVTVDGDDVVAVHHPAKTDRWFVCSHGFVSDKEGSYESRCERAVAEGYHGVRFDHRGCGESDRSFGEQTLETRVADLRAVLSYFDPAECVLFGSSFGGFVALHAAVDDPRVVAVAVRAPVTDTSPFEAYRSSLTEEFQNALETYPFERIERGLSVPVAIFHGRTDETVPLEDSLAAVGRLSTDALVQVYAGEGHRFSRRAENRMCDQLFGWVNAVDGHATDR